MNKTFPPDIDALFNKEAIDKAFLRRGYYQFNTESYHDYGGIQECEHELIDVGFHFTKMVCKKCDKEVS